MKTVASALVKSVLLGLAVLVIVGASHSTARADEVTVSGSTTGITSAPFLTFAGNSNFTATTALGIGSLSGPNHLGTFALSTAPTQLVNGLFQLNITFTSPTGISGGQGATYTATVFGSVSPNVNQGGVNIHFTNPVQTFTFNTGTTTGSFSLTVADLFVQSGQTANLTAGITGEQAPSVPEPTTLLLLGTGLTGLAATARRKLKLRRAQQ